MTRRGLLNADSGSGDAPGREKGVSKVGEEKTIYPLYDFHNYLYDSELPIEGCRFIPLCTLYHPSMIPL